MRSTRYVAVFCFQVVWNGGIDRVQMLDVLASKEEELKELKINRRWLEPKDKEKYNEVNKVRCGVLFSNYWDLRDLVKPKNKEQYNKVNKVRAEFNYMDKRTIKMTGGNFELMKVGYVSFSCS